jgi:hypothetical protein
MKTLEFGKVTGQQIYVYVSSSTLAPAEDEWDAYVAFLTQGFDQTSQVRVIVYTRSPPPSAIQRRKLMDAVKPLAKRLRVAILTDSNLVRGVVTALSWVGGQYTAFAPEQLLDAVTSLGIEGVDAVETRRMVRKFKEQLDA